MAGTSWSISKPRAEDDALYFELDDVEIVESEEVQPGIILDFAKRPAVQPV